MSNLGVHQVYSVLNGRNDTSCERVFLPDEDDIPEYDRSNTKLFALESRRPVREFDIVAFSVSFEHDYLNVLEMLRLAGIPSRKKDREPDDPLLVLGGICTFFNPEPLSEFFDVVIVGEGEEIAGEFIDVLQGEPGKGKTGAAEGALRPEPGVYIPEFYEVLYNDDGTIRERRTIEAERPGEDRQASGEGHRPQAGGHGHSLAAYRVQRHASCRGDAGDADGTAGSAWRATSISRPGTCPQNRPRKRRNKADRSCGKIGLVGSALSDYPGIDDLCASIAGSLSVSSLRADSLSKTLIDRLAKSGHKTIAIAPEAGSERLRKVINKGVTEDGYPARCRPRLRRGHPQSEIIFHHRSADGDAGGYRSDHRPRGEGARGPAQARAARRQDRQDHAVGELLRAQALHALPVGAHGGRRRA